MALKNKDGSVYRLDGPNPVMKTQTTWGKFVLHNMKWSAERYSSFLSSPPQPMPAKDEVEIKSDLSSNDYKDDFVAELEATKSQIKILVPQRAGTAKNEEDDLVEDGKLLPRRTEVHEDKQKKQDDGKPDIDKVFVHCLPAIVSVKRDSLYGELYKTVKYDSPFSFEGVVISEGDMNMTLWTDAQIKKESVIFPKINSKRWWKAISSEAKVGGFILECIPSDYQPSFT